MQLANALLALAGDVGNTVPKFGVTPSEVAVLRFIHGEDAVTDIEVLDAEVQRSSREERERLSHAYGANEGERRVSRAVEALFPGIAARVFDNFEEMELDDSLFKAERVVRGRKADPLDHDGDGKKGGSKKGAESTRARGKKPVEETPTDTDPAPEPEPEDGIGEINDGVMG